MSFFVGNYENKPLSPEEEKRVFRNGHILATASIAFMGGFTFLVHKDIVKLYPASASVDSVKGYAGRIEYALRYQTLLALWLVINVMITMFGRVKTGALNPLDERTETRMHVFKNILTNSFETIVISVFSQLTFVSFASPIVILKFVPMINIIQFVGRVAFFAGYPMLRAFGFISTFLPSVILTLYNTYSLGAFLEAY